MLVNAAKGRRDGGKDSHPTAHHHVFQANSLFRPVIRSRGIAAVLANMTGVSGTVALPGIAALPPSTARQIGSGQVLVDAGSVVKELIDNALDARAKSIVVDIAADTIDAIQVKDDGHGILSEDRPLVCRRYCTSKIRDLRDLRDVGGKWLGFRGEALSSVAEMSAELMVATRVEGEPVAVRLKYGRDGELAS